MTGAPARAERRSVEPPVPDDPALPGLAVALDPAAALPMLSRAFAPLPITGCRADRVRYRRGARAVVQYSVRFEEASGPRDRWVTALVYPPERAREVLKKLRTGSPSTPTGGIPTVKDDPESKLVLQVFPFDRRLPSLGALTDPEPLVSRLGGPAGEPGTWTAVPVRYRAGLACALRWRLDARDGTGGTTWYVKAYRDEQGLRTGATLAALSSRGTARKFTVPRPVGYLDDHRTLVQEESPGASLADVVAGSDDPGPVMERVADALVALQREASADTRRGHADLAVHVQRAASLISWVRPDLGRTAAAVAARAVDGLLEVDPLTAHGDLKPEHVLPGDAAVTFLDLDSVTRTDPVLDAGSMAARLHGLALLHPESASRIEDAGRAFVDAYFARVPSSWWPRFRLRHAGALLHEAAGCFRQQRPRWPEIMDAVVRRAAETLG